MARLTGWTGEETKICYICDKEFYPKSGHQKYCSAQCKGKVQYINGRNSTENQYERISGNWEKYFRRLINIHGREELSVEECLELLEKQEGKCALSGMELTCKLEKGVKSKTNASIDRIEAGGPYIKSNVKLVCSLLNKLRVDTNMDEFVWWCKKVAENHV